MTTAEAVRTARSTAGMTQFDLAVRAGVSPASVHRIEAGRQRPTAATLVVLADALGVPPESLAHTGNAATAHPGRGKTPDDAATAKPRAVGTHQGA